VRCPVQRGKFTTSGSGSIVDSENPAAGTQVKLGTVVTLTLGVPQEVSTNWAGYAVAAATDDFLDVETSFVVPTVSCADQPAGSMVALWAGIDGDGNDTVEQDGIAVYCAGPTYAPDYFAWYEVYPADAVTLSSFDVIPGDTVTAYVAGGTAGGAYYGSLTDSEYGQDVTWEAPAPGSLGATAECIVEDPGNGVGLYPYLSLGSVTMTGCTPSGFPIGSLPQTTAIAMENSTGQAFPSSLSDYGANFTVETTSAGPEDGILGSHIRISTPSTDPTVVIPIP
jgi:hypothetical protein